MAIGLITNPTTPIAIGTVATNTWASNVEDNINGWINGTGPTLKALQIDGIGGAASTTPAGTMQVSSLSGSAAPAPTTAITRNCLYKDMIPLAMANLDPSGSFLYGINVSGVVRNSAGNYTVTLTNACSTSTSQMMPFATVTGGSVTSAAATALSTSTVRIIVYNGTTAADGAVSLIVYGP